MKKLAKLKYLPNNFKIIEDGDHVICAVSGKKISLDNLNYWNVETQEAYYSYKEAHQKRVRNLNYHNFHLLCVQIHCFGFVMIIFSKILLSFSVIFSTESFSEN